MRTAHNCFPSPLRSERNHGKPKAYNQALCACMLVVVWYPFYVEPKEKACASSMLLKLKIIISFYLLYLLYLLLRIGYQNCFLCFLWPLSPILRSQAAHTKDP